MVILFVNRFKKDLKSAPKAIQKKVFEVIENRKPLRISKNQGSTTAKWRGRKAMSTITGFALATGGSVSNTFTPTLHFYGY